MSRKILIDPVTRIEGHSKITLYLNDAGNVENARFHVTQFRGFEKFCEGRPFYEMPSLMARICGICPVSHLVASAKACDALMAVRIPPVAAKLRKVMNLAQIVQSHALSFFYLSAPDLLLGMDAPVASRNIVGLLEKHADAAKDGIFLRSFGQRIIASLGGERIHPSWVVAGGVNAPLSSETRDAILAEIPQALRVIQRSLGWFKKIIGSHREEIRTFANFRTLFLGLVNEKGGWEDYDGTFRFMDATGKIIADHIPIDSYGDYIAESVEPWTYLKFPYYKPIGYPEGMYRVGPLARLNLIDSFGTPLADEEWTEFRELSRTPVLSSFYYHYARLIEILYGIEKIEQLLSEPDILSRHIRAFAGPNNREGIGASEAPRGTLIHHYRIDEHGLITWANLVIATGHNNLAMNRGVLQVAKHFVSGEKISEGMLNRVEAVIRAYDPCLSCSTHAAGTMPLRIELRDSAGNLLDTKIRD
ncbi:MAG: Ni/Fe hydrogenase subunit alpha [Candidatus Ratteibacteria bacterium]